MSLKDLKDLKDLKYSDILEMDDRFIFQFIGWSNKTDNPTPENWVKENSEFIISIISEILMDEALK